MLSLMNLRSVYLIENETQQSISLYFLPALMYCENKEACALNMLLYKNE